MRIFIAEDEPLAAAKLKLFLEKSGEGGDILVYHDGSQLISALNKGDKPDLLFLDIQMPQLTGLEVLQAISTSSFPVILTTAYDQYAIEGFNFGVADYLLKPYTLDRLRQALQKAKLLIKVNKANDHSKISSESITVRTEGRNERIEISQIECLEAVKDYTCLHLSNGRKLLTLGTLTSIEQQLPKTDFVRIQRSYVVNVRKIQSYTTQSAHLHSGLDLPIGKTYKDSFLAIIES